MNICNVYIFFEGVFLKTLNDYKQNILSPTNRTLKPQTKAKTENTQ